MSKDNSQPAQPIRRQFADLATFSVTDRTAVSVRDGVLEYLGVELGLEPADKIFTVYRSPATIANAAYAMAGIPLTDEHVGMDGPAPDTGSTVTHSEVIDQVDEPTHSRLAVRNKLAVSDSMGVMLADKRELSLGYTADLVPHSRWDFEQVGITPHHLAAVHAGRCGPLCSFLDRKPPPPQEGEMAKKLNKAFLDAEGEVNLAQIVEMATSLPDAIREVPVTRLQEIVPALQEVMSYAKEQGAVPAEEVTDEEVEEEVETVDAEGDKEKESAFADSLSKVLGKKVTADKAAAAVQAHSRTFADAEVKRYAQVVNKARNFVDADYDFTDKSANEVMRDALATQSTDTFEDSELAVAFKMLRQPNADYRNFGDAKADSSLDARLANALKEG